MKHDLLLRTACRWITPLLWVLSLIVLYRGHNLPGGGFIGGLLAASAVLLRMLATSPDEAERDFWIEPVFLMGLGLAIAFFSGLLAVLVGKPFMTGLWLPDFTLPILGTMHLGTPLLFDVGVYLVVIGFTLKTAFALGEGISWKPYSR